MRYQNTVTGSESRSTPCDHFTHFTIRSGEILPVSRVEQQWVKLTTSFVRQSARMTSKEERFSDDEKWLVASVTRCVIGRPDHFLLA